MPRLTRNSRDCGFLASVNDVSSVGSIADFYRYNCAYEYDYGSTSTSACSSDGQSTAIDARLSMLSANVNST